MARKSKVCARTDYAACCGDSINVEGAGVALTGPNSLAQGSDPSFWAPYADVWKTYTGAIFQCSHVTTADVSDGTSNTYLVGERFLNPDYYLNGESHTDDWAMYTGFQDDVSRSTYYWHSANMSIAFTPIQDRGGADDCVHFGSAHSNVCQFVFCDGSVQQISYSIDPETHRRLGNRKDGLPIDKGAF